MKFPVVEMPIFFIQAHQNRQKEEQIFHVLSGSVVNFPVFKDFGEKK